MRRVVLEYPAIAGIPLLIIEMVEISPPAQLKVFSGLVVIVGLYEVILSEPRHVRVVEVGVPG